MKTKQDIYKGKRFNLSMGIEGAAFTYPGVCLESYGTLALVQEQKAGPVGRFDTFGIYTVGKDKEGQDQIHSLNIDYGKGGAMDPVVYGAPKAKVKERYDSMVSAMQLKDSEAELRASQQAREAEARAKLQAEKEKKALAISNKRKELRADLILLSEGKSLEKQLSDKKLQALAVETTLFNLLHPEIKK